ncbi:MAG: DUF5615 family PIN-like protein [Bacteroidia bacterium]
MKFIIDEQLSFRLAIWLTKQGFDAFHVNTLGTGEVVLDETICKISMQEQRTVITKDSDFWDTYLVKQQPYKLLYITTGNIANKDLISLFEKNMPLIMELLTQYNVLELNQEELKVHF